MVLGACGIGIMSAQGYYDDDIYYDPSKDKKAQEKAVVTHTYSVQEYQQSYPVEDYPAADTYVLPAATNNWDVDRYNRRHEVNDTLAASVQAADSLAAKGDFAYTRRLEKFYNPEIVINTDDPELIDYYYNSAQPDITINIGTPTYYGSSWSWAWDPWYTPLWATGWSSWYGRPYWGIGWNSWYGPSWSWGWGWDPWWGPAWGPSYAPGWGWAHVHPRPHGNPSPGGWSTGNRRPSGGYTTGNRPGRGSWTGNGYRPNRGNTYRPNGGGNTYRPGNGGNSYRPGSAGSDTNRTYRIGNRRTSTSGSYNSTPSYSRPSQNGNSWNNNSGSYNNRRSESRPSYSTPSSSGFGRGSGGFGGGGRMGGGGGRGGRR